MNAPLEQHEIRTAAIAGLRTLADLLEAEPAIPVPYEIECAMDRGHSFLRRLNLALWVKDAEQMAAVVRALPGTRRKVADHQGNLAVDGEIGGFAVRVLADSEVGDLPESILALADEPVAVSA